MPASSNFQQAIREAQSSALVGPNVVNDPALLITRSMEDFVTWNHHSAIKRKIMKYNDKLDDFQLLGL